VCPEVPRGVRRVHQFLQCHIAIEEGAQHPTKRRHARVRFEGDDERAHSFRADWIVPKGKGGQHRVRFEGDGEHTYVHTMTQPAIPQGSHDISLNVLQKLVE